MDYNVDYALYTVIVPQTDTTLATLLFYILPLSIALFTLFAMHVCISVYVLHRVRVDSL